MSTLWANGDRGLKSTWWQQNSGQYSSHTRSLPSPTILFKKNSIIQHFFTIFLHSRLSNVNFMGKWRQGLKIELGQQSSGLYSSHTRSLPSPTILFKRKFAKSAFFHNFASFQVNKCPLYGQMETWGLKSTSGNKAADRYSLTSHNKFTQPNHPLQEKIR